MSPILRECGQPYCSTLVREGYCERHTRTETRDEGKRREAAPWRYLYTTKTWAAAKARVRARDGDQCTKVEEGRRCFATSRLQVHHLTPLDVLYDRADGSKGAFLDMACNDEILKLLCPAHHRQADLEVRRAMQDYRRDRAR